MSAFGPKQTLLIAPHMSAFGGKADIGCARSGGTISKIRYGIQWHVQPRWDTISDCQTSIVWFRPWAPPPNSRIEIPKLFAEIVRPLALAGQRSFAPFANRWCGGQLETWEIVLRA